MKKTAKQLIYLFSRYLLIVLLGLGNLFIFYKIFTLPTIKLSSFILSFFGNLTATGNLILFNNNLIELIPACIAGSAYYLLFILIFSTPDIKIQKRTSLILFSFLSLFILNILRIVILSLASNSVYFNSIHMFFWYILSTLFVVFIWFFSVKIFNIKKIPFYSDLKILIKLVKRN